MMPIKPLQVEQLYQKTDPDQFNFQDTEQLEDLTEIIGQPPSTRSPMFSDSSASCESLSASRMETLELAIRKEWLHHELDDIP